VIVDVGIYLALYPLNRTGQTINTIDHNSMILAVFASELKHSNNYRPTRGDSCG
jgi:hypothetical protein